MVARRQGWNNLVQNGYLLNGNNSATYPYFLVINQLLFKVAGDPFFILITTLDISFFLTLSLSAEVFSISVYGLVYGRCVSINPSLTRHSSTLPSESNSVANCKKAQYGQRKADILHDRAFFCSQLKAGLVSISGRPLLEPSPGWTRYSLIPPLPL